MVFAGQSIELFNKVFHGRDIKNLNCCVVRVFCFFLFSSSSPSSFLHFSCPHPVSSSAFFFNLHLKISCHGSGALRSSTLPGFQLRCKCTSHYNARLFPHIEEAIAPYLLVNTQHFLHTDVCAWVKRWINCWRCSCSMSRFLSPETYYTFTCCYGEAEYRKEVWMLGHRLDGQLQFEVGLLHFFCIVH